LQNSAIVNEFPLRVGKS